MRVTQHLSLIATIELAMLLLLLPSVLLAQPDASISYLDQWEVTDSDGLKMSCPFGLAWDWEGKLLVSSGVGGPIPRCTTTGECESYAFRYVRKLVVDKDRNVLMTAQEANKIWICDETGACPDSFGSLGLEPGQFEGPIGITIDSLGRTVIADRLNNRIQFCNLDGECTVSTGGGRFMEPASLVVDGKGALYVGELGDEYVHICDEDGTCSKRLGSEGSAVGQFKTPIALQLSSRGDLVILELSNNRIQVCDLNGNCFAYGESGFGNGQFAAPGDMVMDDQDRIYVADCENHRVQVLQLTYNSPPPDPQFQINAGLSDAWFNPFTNGQGFFVNVFPVIGEVFVGWFTYEVERPPEDAKAVLGEPGHRWLSAGGKFQGDTATMNVYLSSGGVFDSEQPVVGPPDIIGTMDITWSSCNSATVTYDLPSLGLSGTIPIQRIVLDNLALCEVLADQ